MSVDRKMWILIPCFLVLGVVRGRERPDLLVETKLGVIRGLHSDDGDYAMFLGIPYGKLDSNNPFGMLTRNPKQCQVLLNAVEDFCSWTDGLRTKPSKCHSLYMGRRNTKFTSYDPSFIIGGQSVTTVAEAAPFKFEATPHPRFEEVFLANDDSVKCPQVEEFNNTIVGTLDCLLLNIHVPSGASSRSKLPVLVWIYGGIFQYGFAGRYLYGPKYIVKNNIIFVTLNFRNGPYGFMCLDTPEVPGNQGLKDQLLALRWVHDNIESFGGDVNKVTLGGESSGAASVECHLWSKKETLFNQAIIQSGSIFAPWAITEPDLTQPFKLAERLGYHTDDLSKALSFLSKTDVKLLIAAVRDLSMMFNVCVEKEFENVASFLTEHPRHLNVPRARNTPILIGSTDKERMALYENKPESDFKNMNVFNKSLNEIFNYDEDFFKMEDIVRQFYIGNEEISNTVREKLTDFSSDFDFAYPTQKSLQTFVDNGAKNIYNYVFTYNGKRSFTKKRENIQAKGAAHGDELSYFFDMSYDPSTPTEEDQQFIDRFAILWTNFVKYGNPTPETTELIPIKWSPVTKKSHKYLNIDSVLSEGTYPFNDVIAFWGLFFEANKKKLKAYNTTVPFK